MMSPTAMKSMLIKSANDTDEEWDIALVNSTEAYILTHMTML